MDKKYMADIKDIPKKEKKKLRGSITKQLFFCMISLFLIILLYIAAMFEIKNTKYICSIENRGKAVSQDVIFEIEKMKVGTKEIEISGWIAWNNVDWKWLSIVLQDNISSEMVICKAELVERLDVDDCFDMSREMKCSGFKAVINSEKLKKDTSYELLLDISYKEVNVEDRSVYSGIKISTDRFIYNAMEYAYNPLEYVQPNIELNDVIQSGRVCDYSREYGTWIYLYENKIYWIIDSEKIPPLEDTPSIPILMFVNRDDLVPEEQLEEYIMRGYIYDEIYLNESHYFDKDSSKYYVVSYELPREYPITYIQTGPYGNRNGIEWLFKSVFRVHTLEEMKQWQ